MSINAEGLAREFGLSKDQSIDFVAQITKLFSLPFAETDVILDLLIFKFTRLPRLREKSEQPELQRMAELFEVFLKMLLQGNSLHPGTVVNLAVKTKLCLETYPHFVYRLEPLVDLLIAKKTGEPKAGFNRLVAADPDTIIKCEQDRQDGAMEHIYKEGHKLENYRQEVLSNPEFKEDWQNIKKNFKVSKYQDSRKIIRRSKVPERNWPTNVSCNLDRIDDRFRAVFDFFCWKWFLYGMKEDHPLIEKLTFTITPYGTQIFIPGYWSFDGARDIDWKQIAKAHKARGIQRQGEKLTSNKLAKKKQLERLFAADQEANSKGIRGEKRYAFLKKQASLAPETDNAQVRRLLREAILVCKHS